MGKFLLICLFLCTGICKTSAQIVDLSKFVKAKKSKTEVFSQKLQNTRDSLLRICKIYKLEDFKYKFPTIYLGESMESLKAKSKEFEKIKVEIYGFTSLPDDLREYCKDILEIFDDVHKDTPNVTFELIS